MLFLKGMTTAVCFFLLLTVANNEMFLFRSPREENVMPLIMNLLCIFMMNHVGRHIDFCLVLIRDTVYR